MTDKNYDIGEINPIVTKKSNLNENRLNILIPAISDRHMFGGISTAMRFFYHMRSYFDDLRIIVIDEDDTHKTSTANIKEFIKSNNEESDKNGQLIHFVFDRKNSIIPIRKNDLFISTAWWTDIILKEIKKEQCAYFKNARQKKHIYIIQDYEPGFYPFSTRYALAESTYVESDDTIALMNSKFLNDHFIKNDYKFHKQYYFDPIINPDLKSKLKHIPKTIKDKKILIYGRPDTPRNCFDIILQGLVLWSSKNPESKNWKIYSAGQKHKDINLENNNTLISLGKLPIEEYADHLLTSYCGISLMVSPHPSYPPLEMSAFNLKIITNRFKQRSLSSHLPETIELDVINAKSISNALDIISHHHETNTNINITPPTSNYLENFMNRTNEFEHVSLEIFKNLDQEISK